MDKTKQQYTTIDEYISLFPEGVQEKLEKIRNFIKDIVPESTETISYQMPTFDLEGKHLVYFAAFKHHIGFYPFPSGIEAFKDEISEYKTSKGSIQFPLDKPIPFDLIKKILKFRVKETKLEKK